MRKQTITWYKLEEKEPPNLVPVIFNVFIKFNAKKAFRYGYYNKLIDLYQIDGAMDQYKLQDNFLKKENKYFDILEWANIKINEKQTKKQQYYPCGGLKK